MKRWICLVFVLMLCVSFCGCGARARVEKQASTAPEFDYEAYMALKESDPAKAKSEYDGKIYRYTVEVCDIKATYCVVGFNEYNAVYDYYVTKYTMRIYLERDVLEQIRYRHTYTFAGVLEYDDEMLQMRNAIVIEEAQ